MRIIGKGGCLLLLGAGLVGCGQSHSASPKPDGQSLLGTVATFSQWCASWQLTCPTGTPPDVPTAGAPWSAAQWKALMGAIKAVGESSVNFEVARAELDSPNLATVATQLQFTDVLAQVKDRLDAVHSTSAALANSKLTLTSASAASFTGASGLATDTDAQVALTVTDGLDIAATGLGLGGSGGAASLVNTVSFPAPNVLAWSGPDLEVTGVPTQFLAEEVSGIKLGAANVPTMTYTNFQPAIAPLVAWLLTGQRDVDLGTTAFAKLATEVPQLLTDQDTGKAVGTLLGQLSSITSTAAVRVTKVVTGAAPHEIDCTIGTEAQIMIQPQFGVQSLAANGDGVTIVVYGIKAKPLSGIIKPTIDLGTIDLLPTSIVIHNVPVIGTYTIDMSDPSSQGSLSCS